MVAKTFDLHESQTSLQDLEQLIEAGEEVVIYANGQPIARLIPYGSSEMTAEDVENQIRAYEEQFGMSSEEFLQLRKAGTAPDSFETTAWSILLKHR